MGKPRLTWFIFRQIYNRWYSYSRLNYATSGICFRRLYIFTLCGMALYFPFWYDKLYSALSKQQTWIVKLPFRFFTSFVKGMPSSVASKYRLQYIRLYYTLQVLILQELRAPRAAHERVLYDSTKRRLRSVSQVVKTANRLHLLTDVISDRFLQHDGANAGRCFCVL